MRDPLIFSFEDDQRKSSNQFSGGPKVIKEDQITLGRYY